MQGTAYSVESGCGSLCTGFGPFIRVPVLRRAFDRPNFMSDTVRERPKPAGLKRWVSREGRKRSRQGGSGSRDGVEAGGHKTYDWLCLRLREGRF